MGITDGREDGVIGIHLPTMVSHAGGQYSMWFQVDSDDDDSPLEVFYQLYAIMMGWA